MFCILFSKHFCFACFVQWARQLGQMTDQPVRVPLHSCELTELVTKPLDGIIDANMPGNHLNAEPVLYASFKTAEDVHCSVVSFKCCEQIIMTVVN